MSYSQGARVGQLPLPGQRRRRGAGLVAGALDLVDRGDLDGHRHVLQRSDEVGERGAVGVVDQGHVGERVARQGGGEVVGHSGRRVGVVTAERGACRAHPHEQSGDPETE